MSDAIEFNRRLLQRRLVDSLVLLRHNLDAAEIMAGKASYGTLITALTNLALTAAQAAATAGALEILAEVESDPTAEPLPTDTR